MRDGCLVSFSAIANRGLSVWALRDDGNAALAAVSCPALRLVGRAGRSFCYAASAAAFFIAALDFAGFLCVVSFNQHAAVDF